MTDRSRILIASVVARSWAREMMQWPDQIGRPGALAIESRTCAHPLACVRVALTGESDPVELGIAKDGKDAEFIRRIEKRYG